MVRVLAFAATLTLAGCQAFWDLPSQMRKPYGSTGSPPPPIQNQAIQNQTIQNQTIQNRGEEESLP